ncbi:MAG TPA: short chain dehydrogenase [Cytophagales bacterium]|nr:short chain dehydrogenase [Cytophagales bacterium]HAA21316.1 short chain dehydrogenase [Cytophagales bacterium]HAP63781.1 short chain dehydrogenase [Cytophagales bacterium]
MTRIKDSVVWVTGASSGIGEGLATELSKAGAKVIISARREAELERVKALCAHPDQVAVLPLDLVELEDMEEKVKAAIAAFGRVDMLINNGGISQRDLTVNTAVSVYERIMKVNYLGTVALTKAILPHMLARKSGHIVAVSSLTGKFGTPYRSGYAGSKHALHGFFDSLRAEIWRENVKVLMVAPGFIRTQISVNALVGSGEKLGKMDEAQANGMPADKCARIMMRAIEKEKEEILVGGTREVMGVYVKRLFPKLFSRIIRKANVR